MTIYREAEISLLSVVESNEQWQKQKIMTKNKVMLDQFHMTYDLRVWWRFLKQEMQAYIRITKYLLFYIFMLQLLKKTSPHTTNL